MPICRYRYVPGHRLYSRHFFASFGLVITKPINELYIYPHIHSVYISNQFYPQGSVLNFFLTKNVEERIGLSWTLWGGAFLCLLGFVAAILTSVLDIAGVKQLGQVSFHRRCQARCFHNVYLWQDYCTASLQDLTGEISGPRLLLCSLFTLVDGLRPLPLGLLL